MEYEFIQLRSYSWLISMGFLHLILFLSAPLVNGKFEESSLLKHLLKDYDTFTRPVEDISDTTTLQVGLGLHQLITLDEKRQIISTNMQMSLTWDDARMKWNPQEHNNISLVRIPPHLLWIPDLHLYNTAEEQKSLQQLGDIVYCLVYNHGKVLWVVPLNFKSTCKMDVTWFPFDVQKCSWKFGSWTFNGNELALQLYPNQTTVDLKDYVEHGEWQVLGTNATQNIQMYDCCPEPYLNLEFTINFRRRTLYYFFNLLVPCGLIGFLALLGFTLPPDSKEKLSLGVTVMFSLIVFLNMIAESMPANSDSVPLIGTYFNCIMVMIALSVVSTLVANLNKRKMRLEKISTSGLTGKLLFVWLPWILRMNVHHIGRHGGSVSAMKIENITNIKDLALKQILGIDKDINETHKQVETVDQWKFVAILLDRICFILSIIFILVSVLIFLNYAT